MPHDEPFRIEEDATQFKSSRNAADFYRNQPVMDRRIHVLGVGNVGILVAHALRGIQNPPPITLIFPRLEKYQEWEASSKQLTVITEGDAESRDGFEAELARARLRHHGKEVGLSMQEPDANLGGEQEPLQTYPGESTAPISSLIVSTKAIHVLASLSAVKHRLNKDSVVLFLQNGMGIVEEVNQHIFPDPATRPHYMLGINSHGVNNADVGAFTTTHAGFGTVMLGLLPHERDRDPAAPFEGPKSSTTAETNHSAAPSDPDPAYPPPASANFHWTPNQRYLLRIILRTPVLGATSFSPTDLLQMQLEKLAVNCIINPLTVVLDARNGAVLYNYALTRVLRLLLAEISLVIRSLPELMYIPNVQTRFDPGRLETVVVGVANKTKNNISSMLGDARAGRQTEIEYINGWIVKRGEELGIKCLMNYMLVQLVKGKGALISREIDESLALLDGTLEDTKGEGVEMKIVEKTAEREEKLED